jgi:hypothetical protein
MLIGFALFWDITQRRMVILYRIAGQRMGPIFKGPIRCPETSIKVYRSTLRNTTEERRFPLPSLLLKLRNLQLFVNTAIKEISEHEITLIQIHIKEQLRNV